MGYCVHSIRVKLSSGKGIDDAEDWIRNTITGPWKVEFMGLGMEPDAKTGFEHRVVHVDFRFAKPEDLTRFKREYLGMGVTAKRKAKKRGLLAQLFG